MYQYGTSRDLGTPEMPANPNCTCNPLQATFCMHGHMLECHTPMTCQEAQCQHYERSKDW